MPSRESRVGKPNAARRLPGGRNRFTPLPATEEQYRLLFKLNPNPMWIFDAATLQFLAVNEAAVKFYGWSREEFLRMTVKDVHPPEEMLKLARKLARQRASRAAFVGEWRHRKKDHTVFDIEVTLSCLRFQGRDARLTMVKDITEHKRTEEALRSSRRTLEAVIHHMPAAVNLIRGSDLRLQFVNPAYQAIAPGRKMVGRTLDEIWPEAGKDFAALCRRVLKTGKPYHVEDDLNMIRRRPGGPLEPAHFNWSLHRVLLPGKEGWGILNTSWDVTLRKRAEEALRANQAQMRLALRAAEAASWIWDFKPNRTVWSPEYYALYGIKPKVAPSFRNWLACIHPDDRKVVERIVERTLRNHAPEFSFEFRIRHPVKGERWIANKGRVTYTAEGQPITATGINLDVTERKCAEKQLQEFNATLERRVAERTEELSDAYDRLRAIADNALVGILTLNTRGIIETLNPAATNIFGYTPDEMLGHNISRFIASPVQVEGEPFLAHCTQPGEQRFIGVGREALGRRKDGYGILLELTVSEFTHRGQREFVAMVRDITARKQLERELLEISERERQRIGRDLHDGLGQQLHGVSYLVALLEKGLREDASPRAAEVGRLNKYLHEALELARSLAHGLQPVKSLPQGLMMALRELADRTRSLYGMDCRFECRKLVLVHRLSAATHLYRIAQEAVNNSVKHGKPTRIRIRLAATRQRIFLGVRDNGVGIHHRKRPAKGMGLHIMQYRADAIRGSLAVQKLPQRGTEVVCTVAWQALLTPEE